MLESCPHSEKFHLEKTADAGEFLSFIFGLFNIPFATTKTITYGTNSSEKIVPHDELIVTSEINDNNIYFITILIINNLMIQIKISA